MFERGWEVEKSIEVGLSSHGDNVWLAIISNWHTVSYQCTIFSIQLANSFVLLCCILFRLSSFMDSGDLTTCILDCCFIGTGTNVWHMPYVYWIFLHNPPWISVWIKLISSELDIANHVMVSQLYGHGDVVSNRLWRHQQNENGASETRGWWVQIVIFIVIFGFIMSCKK